MKITVILATLLLTGCMAAWAQLPEKFAIIAGGGVSFPYVKQYEYDFYSKYGDRPGYNLLAEGAVGVDCGCGRFVQAPAG